MNTKYIATLLIALFSMSATAEVHQSLSLVARTKPFAANPMATIAYDGLLHGEYSKEKPMYGYYRVGAKVGGTPSYGAYLQVAPIAPLVLEVQKGYTRRFVNISTIDCNANDCRGMVERTDYTVRFVGAVKEFVLLGNVTWRELIAPDSAKPVGLEQEYFTVTPGFHRYFETNFILGYRLPENKMAGIMATNGTISQGDRKMSSVYGIYRFPAWEDYNLTVGAGSYRSDAPDQDGFSAIFSISRTWGDKLSLF